MPRFRSPSSLNWIAVIAAVAALGCSDSTSPSPLELSASLTMAPSIPATTPPTQVLRVDVTGTNRSPFPVETNESSCNIDVALYTTPEHSGNPVWTSPTNRPCRLVLILGSIDPGVTRTISDYFTPPAAGTYYGVVTTGFPKKLVTLDAGSVTIP